MEADGLGMEIRERHDAELSSSSLTLPPSVSSALAATERRGLLRESR